MKVAFPIAPEPDADTAEAARKLFAGPIGFLTSAPALEHLPSPDVPEVTFAGRSNVGKSSLLNAPTGRKSLDPAAIAPLAGVLDSLAAAATTAVLGPGCALAGRPFPNGWARHPPAGRKVPSPPRWSWAPCLA